MDLKLGKQQSGGRDSFPLEDKLLPLQYGAWKSGPELLEKIGQFNCAEEVIGISTPKKSMSLCLSTVDISP